VAERTVSAGLARGLMEFAIAKGADAAALAMGSGIDPALLEDRDARIPFDRYVALMRAGKDLTGDPALALHFGAAVPMEEMSIACLVGRAAETLAEGFAQTNRYNRLVVEVDLAAPDRFQLRREGGALWMVDTRRNPDDFPELTESTFARMVTASRRWFPQERFVRAVHVTHAEPAYRAAYDSVFQLPVTFGSDRNALLTDDAWLTTKSSLSSRYIFGLLSEKADALLAELEKAKSMRGRVEAALMPILHTGAANMKIVAGRFGLSRDTLYRRLKAEGATFETVLDSLRHKLALDYLSARKVSVNEAAYLVGFSDAAAFSRAFKRWTGVSPRDYSVNMKVPVTLATGSSESPSCASPRTKPTLRVVP
jgi:AraC-like DNA-binding protein